MNKQNQQTKLHIRIVPLNEQLIEPLTDLTIQLWPQCNKNEEIANWKECLHSSNDAIYLAETEGNNIGFVHVSIRNDYVEGTDKSPVGYIEAIFINEHYRKYGVGRKLIEYAENWIISKNIFQIASDTPNSNVHAIAFHEKLGFDIANTIVCFVKNL